MLAAVVFEAETHETVRAAMHELHGARHTRKLHWNEMNEQQHTAAKTVAELEGFHVVTTGTPVLSRDQERARKSCLERLVAELHSYAVTHLPSWGWPSSYTHCAWPRSTR